MQTELFKVRFTGDTVEGREPEQIIAALAQLGLDADKAKRLLGSRSAVLRKGLTRQQAEQWRGRLLQAGVHVLIEADTSPAEGVAHSDAGNPGQQSLAAQAEPASADLAVTASKPSASAGQSAAAAMQRLEPVRFSGDGREYFGIWIVNIILMVLTLGFYAPWAKVRNNQYFYGHTSIDGSSFQYLANPWVIFRGRLIAVAALILWVVVSNLSAIGALILMLLFIPLLPWIIIAGLRFHLYNSAWRNIRFGFDGGYWQAFMVIYVWPILSILSLGLLVPYSMYRSQQFILDNMRFGTTNFSLQLGAREYYIFVLKMLGMLLLFFVGGALLLMVPVIGFIGGVLILVGYLLALGYFMAALPNMVYKALRLQDHGFDSRLGKRRIVWIFVTNTLFIVLTLGLFTPWAKVRMARYRASCTDVLINGDLDRFVAGAREQQNALGMEMGEAFDVGVLGV